jgi:outer membrane lipoprotein SlyB
VAAGAILGGCASNSQPRYATTATAAAITDSSRDRLRHHRIDPGNERGEGRTSGAGAVVGGLVGALAGNQVGSGGGRTAATVAGGVAGAAIGNNVERNRNPAASRCMR